MLKLLQRQNKNIGKPKGLIISESNYMIINFLSYVIYFLSVGFFVSIALGLSFEEPLIYNKREILSIHRLIYFYLGIIGVLSYIFTYNSPNNLYKIIQLHLENKNEIYAKSFQITFLGFPFISWISSLILIPFFSKIYFATDFWFNTGLAFFIVTLSNLLLSTILTGINLFFNDERFYKYKSLAFIAFVIFVFCIFDLTKKKI